MSYIPALAASRTTAGAVAHTLGRTLARWWMAYMTWRIERLALARLRTMSDRQLADFGVVRSQIEFAVKLRSGREPQRGDVARRVL